MAKATTHKKRQRKRSALVLINMRSGTVRSRGAQQVEELVRNALAHAFSPLQVELCDGDILPRLREAVAAYSHDVVIAGGGDGTIASVAGELLGSGITMATLPLGTMNLFVQALGFSSDLETALQQMRHAEEGLVDVGEANGRIFLHQVSFGLQPRMARLRERIGYSSRLTKMWAAARALAVLALRPKTVRVILQANGTLRRVKTPVLIVSNNPLGSQANVSLPLSLRDGVLGLYVLEQFNLPSLLHLALDYLAGRVAGNPAVSIAIAPQLTIRRSRGRFERRASRKSLQASMDGETLLLQTPVRIRIRPSSLKVLMLPAHKAEQM